jgi:hypothetical protein
MSETILIFLTRDYLSSKNCRRELVAAYRQRKPLLVLVETDDDKGAPSVASLQGERDLFKKRQLSASGAADLTGEDKETFDAMDHVISKLIDPSGGGYVEVHRCL